MALISLTSANGSPGVTTTALGLAASWPRPVVLVEADPTGASGIAAGFFRGTLPPGNTIVDLAMSHRQGTLAEDLPKMLVSMPGNPDVQILPGAVQHNQARSLENVWEPLTGAFKALEANGQDVIVDAGRLGLEGSPTRLLTGSDLTLLLTRSTLPGVVGARSWASTLTDWFTHGGAGSSIALGVVGPGMPYSEGNISKVLGLPVTATLAWDPPAAEVFSRGATPPRRFAASNLSRSLRACVEAIQASITTSRSALGMEEGTVR